MCWLKYTNDFNLINLIIAFYGVPLRIRFSFTDFFQSLDSSSSSQKVR